MDPLIPRTPKMLRPDSVRLSGDRTLAASYRGEAMNLLFRCESAGMPQLSKTYPDGTIVTVKCLSGMNIVSITAGKTEETQKQAWILLYAPCPAPDPQDWPGWIEANKTSLVAENFNNLFTLANFGSPIYGDFTPTPVVNSTTPYKTVTQMGWSITGGSWHPPPINFFGIVWKAVGFAYKGTIEAASCTYMFPGGLIPTKSVESKSDTYKTITAGSEPTWLYWYSGPPTCNSNPPDAAFIGFPDYVQTSREGYISWQSTYQLGFWKTEWTRYNPSSYLDKDNYVLFYDYYKVQTDTASGAALYTTISSCDSSYLYDPGQGYIFLETHDPSRWAYYEAIYGASPAGHVLADPKVAVSPTAYGYNWKIYDPKALGDGTTSRSQLYATYETHICGKFEGAWFDEVIATATYNGGWSGDNAFPWMGRVYDKNTLTTVTDGKETPEVHNLLLASWLIGPASGSALSDTNAVPGCTGITSTVYRMMGGSATVDKTYSAVHPGWHSVFTDPDTGRTWRAYGDLFAALTPVEEEE